MSRKASIREVPDASCELSSTSRALARSVVCRRLPMNLRVRVDEAILLRPKKSPTLEAIAERFELDKYHVSIPALRAYARRLENMARPAATGQLLASVFGCLPAGYQRRILSGTQVLLLSKVVQALCFQEAAPLSVSELARLGSVLAAMARPFLGKGNKGKPGAAGRRGMTLPVLSSAVRDIYGLSLPRPPGESATAEITELAAASPDREA